MALRKSCFTLLMRMSPRTIGNPSAPKMSQMSFAVQVGFKRNSVIFCPGLFATVLACSFALRRPRPTSAFASLLPLLSCGRDSASKMCVPSMTLFFRRGMGCALLGRRRRPLDSAMAISALVSSADCEEAAFLDPGRGCFRRFIRVRGADFGRRLIDPVLFDPVNFFFLAPVVPVPKLEPLPTPFRRCKLWALLGRAKSTPPAPRTMPADADAGAATARLLCCFLFFFLFRVSKLGLEDAVPGLPIGVGAGTAGTPTRPLFRDRLRDAGALPGRFCWPRLLPVIEF